MKYKFGLSLWRKFDGDVLISEFAPESMKKVPSFSTKVMYEKRTSAQTERIIGKLLGDPNFYLK